MLKKKTRQRQRGLSLLELMLSMTIGLLLLMALGALMITSNRLAISRSSSERLDDNARQIFWRLEQDLRHAGYVDAFANSATLKRVINLHDQEIFNAYVKDQSSLQQSALAFVTNGKIIPLRGCGSSDLFTNRDRLCGDNRTTTQQSLMVSYQVLRSTQALAHSGLSGQGQEGDKGSQSSVEESCSGTSATATEPLLTHIYALHKGGLSCIGIRNGLNANATTQIRSASQPIVSNVEEMMFRYLVMPEGEADSADEAKRLPTQSIHQYLTAKQVEESALGWASVVGVEICLVLGAEPIDGRVDVQNAAQTHRPTCARAEQESREPNAAWAANLARTAGDHKVYRRYQRVMALPNHLHVLNIQL